MEDILTYLSEWAETFFSEQFMGNALHAMGISVWNWAVEMIGLVASTTPDAFSKTAWNYTTEDVLDFTMGIGATLLNTFYMVGMIRQSTNLKENFTFEVVIDSVIKMLFGNLLILHGLDLMKILFETASVSSEFFLISDPPSFDQTDVDAGSVLFNFLFGGVVFLAVSLVCAFTIFLTLYSRYLYLYMLIAVYPIAFSTLPGGHGVYNTASSFVRTFISKTFEIVVIAIAVSIAAKMCNAIDFGTMDGVAEYFDGAIQTIQSMATMIILTASVKGCDIFMRRAFGL